MFKKIINFIETHNLIKPHDKIIVGLSGGPDSVFLLLFLRNISYKFNLEIIGAHLDHEWRDNSYLDLELCKKLCESNNINLISKKASEIKLEKKLKSGSKEDLGRLLRRQFFQNLLKSYNANSIALAHHYDDQIETFFIRLIRGSTISGLASIKAKNGPYIRPLLSIDKSEILDYLEKNNIQYIKDYTNEEDLYLRNRIRKIIPEFQKADKRFKTNFAKTLDNINKTNNFLEKLTQEKFTEIYKIMNNIIYIDKNKFLKVEDFLKSRILILWFIKEQVEFVPSEKLFEEILRFIMQVNPKSNKHTIYSSWSICKKQKFIFIEKN